MPAFFQSPRFIALSIALIIVVAVIVYDHASPRGTKTVYRLVNSGKKTIPAYHVWKECMMNDAEKFRGDYEKSWREGWGVAINKCGQGILSRLNVSEYRNKDESKYHILPRENTLSTIVTLGIGKDTEAEKALLNALGKDNVNFFGADPIYETNDLLYSEIGKYFPFAVSASAGYSTASVYINNVYVNKVVVNVDLVYFLKRMVNRTFYDSIWMDAEHAEYGLFPAINKGGALDQNEITVCQWNMEIHDPDLTKKRLTHDFLFQTLQDERYGFVKHLLIAGHYRMFFINFEDERCLKKYFPDDLLPPP